MFVLLDIDCTLCDFLGWVSYKLRKQPNHHPRTNKTLTELFGISEYESTKLIALTEAVSDPQPLPGAAKKVREFYQAGYKIVYLSAAPPHLKVARFQWLTRYGFPTERVLLEHVGSSEKKLNWIRSVATSFELAVDDMPQYLDLALLWGAKKTYLISYPWNESIMPIHRRVKGWDEIKIPG